MKNWSVRWRISVLVGAVLVTVIATISIVAYVELGEALWSSLDQQLLTTARGLMAEMEEEHAPGDLAREVDAIAGNSARAKPTVYRMWVAGGDQDVLASDSPDSERGRLARSRSPGPAAPEQFRTFDGSAEGRPYRGLWLRETTRLGDTHVVVLQSSRRTHHEMREFLRLLLILGVATMLAALLLSAMIVRKAIRPIGRAARRLDQVTYATLGRDDLSELALPEEVEPFLHAVIELLERLDQSTRKQKQLTADASHELRTPLTTAKSALQLARLRDREGADYRRAIDEALTDLGRMEKLIDQLLALARMDADDGQMDHEVVAIDKVVADLADTWQDRTGTDAGHVVYEVEAGLGVRADADQLRRMLANLLANALLHGPKGGTVRVTLRGAGPDVCEIEVHDEGGAIPPETIGRLFDRFYRVDSSRQSDTGGTGLGLSIARQIALRHGGDIQIESSPATGTTARVRLPRA